MVKKPDLTLTVGGIRFPNPVLAASGTFGYGDEVSDLAPLKRFGGIITKTITREPRPGNPPPRLAETASGLLNTIGLQNIGLERFATEKWPVLAKLPIPVIVSIAGTSADEYEYMYREVSRFKGVAAVELNLSCPNLRKQIVCQNPGLAEEIIRRTVNVGNCPVIAKLSPAVPDLPGLARIIESAGANALSLVNTFPGMAIDAKTWKPRLSSVTGGLSGPAVKPMALRCVWEVCRSVRIPVAGGGGITSAEDAVEFLLAGASLVTVGTASFTDPGSVSSIAEGVGRYLASRRLGSPRDIIGRLIIP